MTRPPARVRDPKRASVSVSARSYNRITRMAGALGVSRGRLVESHIRAFLDEQDSLINTPTRREFGAYSSAELDLIGEGDHVRLRVRDAVGKASIFLNSADLHWLIERARHLKGKLP